MASKGTVLVVDDEELLRNAIVFQFKREGFEVLSASNGKEAFEIIKTQKVDAVVSDIQMPGGNGIDLLKDVKNFDAEIPVLVFITAFADITEAEAYDLGANAIFSKPFDRKQLVKTISDSIIFKGRNWKTDTVSEVPAKNLASNEPVVLGRGGAFVQADSNTFHQNDDVTVDLQAKLGDNVVQLKGKGKVRWVSPDGLGVEFVQIQADARESYDSWLDKNRIKAYIPKKVAG